MSQYQEVKLPLYGDSPLQVNNEVIMNLININSALTQQMLQNKEKHFQEINVLNKEHSQEIIELKEKYSQEISKLREENTRLRVAVLHERKRMNRTREKKKNFAKDHRPQE